MEDKKDVDGDFNAFNFCLAEDYFYAMIQEDFEFLGNMSTTLLEQIQYWLNYDGNINSDIVETISKIPTGDIITIKERTFAEAVIENKKGSIAETLILKRK